MAETDYVTTLRVVSWVLGSLVIVITVARILGRTLVTKQTGWDDFFMVTGSVTALVCSALVTIGTSYGLGTHQAQITDPRQLSEAIKYTIIAPNFSILSSTCSKISILIFLVRLMGMSAKRWHLYMLWGLCTILVGLNILAIVVILRFCDPPQKQWEPTLPGECLDPQIQRDLGFVQTSYNAFMDIFVAIFPAFVIAKLNINRKTKLGLSLLMGGGVFAAAATIVKVYLLKDIGMRSDITWYWAPITLWYTAEMDVIVIVGTIPTLWPLVRLIRKNADSRNEGVYDAVTSDVSCRNGSAGFQGVGSATRVLQELDNMPTLVTWNDESVRRDHP